MAVSFLSILLLNRSGLLLVTVLSQYFSHVGQLIQINIKRLNTVTAICYLVDFCFVFAVCRDLNKPCAAENTLFIVTYWTGRSVCPCGIPEQRRQQNESSKIQ